MSVVLLGLAQAYVSASQAAETALPAEQFQLEIGRTQLTDALKRIGEHTGLQIARFSDTEPVNVLVGPLSGSFTREQALKALLRGTGLTYRFVNNRTVAIIKEASATLPPPPGNSTQPAARAVGQAAQSVAPDSTNADQKTRDNEDLNDAGDEKMKRHGLLSRVLGFLTACSVATLAAGPVCAQTSVTTNEDSANELATAVVSSTRLQNAGFDAPTPTQVLNSSDLQKIADPNIFDAVIELPALQGSTGTTYETVSTSTGLQGLSALSLRGFSPLRTLTLLDGERVVGANYNGVVDVSLLPQALIQRVDVVTGGASASWGSDAIAGVVNFVTDKKFDGIKVDASYGRSTFQDNGTATFKLAAGTGFADNRGHIEVAGEYMNDTGVLARGDPNTNFGCAGIDGRNYQGCSGTQTQTVAGTPPGTPEYIWAPVTQNFQQAKYGLITAGPLEGIGFGVNGTPYNFNYAGGGTPSGKASGVVNGCISPLCISTTAQPGDLSNQYQAATLSSAIQRTTLFTRLSYDITPTTEIFTTIQYGGSTTVNEPGTGITKNGNLTIQCANPYVPASIQASCTANGITNFQYSVYYPFPAWQSVFVERDQRRYVIGADGSFDLFSKGWTWDTYAEYGETVSNLHVSGEMLNPNFNAAINAVAGPNGTIQCASAAARATGCVPFDIIGNVPNTSAAFNYVEPPNGPYDYLFQRQEAFGATLNGKPFADWAGDISTAIGVDYRLENYHSLADPYGNGVSGQDPYTATYPYDPNNNAAAGNNWFAGNYHEGHGQYEVDEVFVETGIPLFKTAYLGALNADLAARYEHYSEAGGATTWKMGLVWDTPLSGVRLRALESEDLRAPNLSEAFAPNSVISSSTNNPFLPGNPNVDFNQVNEGNINLKPETSKTAEVGIVFQPEYVPGFRASADYYHIDVSGIIASLTVGQVVQLCYDGNKSFCGQDVIQTVGAVPVQNGGTIVSVASQVFNLASATTDGLDLETSYQFDLSKWNVPGNFAIRGLATKVYKFYEDPGIPGQPNLSLAGALGQFSTSTTYNATGGTIPTWKTFYTEEYSNTWGSFSVMQRWFNAGTFANNYVVCQAPNCPVPTVANPTINYNHMPGAIYWDAYLGYKISERGELYGKVNNIANLMPPPSGSGINLTIYDVIGRMYYLGVRYHL
jgi:outer membrane receptor protein involved in Fe transport